MQSKRLSTGVGLAIVVLIFRNRASANARGTGADRAGGD